MASFEAWTLRRAYLKLVPGQVLDAVRECNIGYHDGTRVGERMNPPS